MYEWWGISGRLGRSLCAPPPGYDGTLLLSMELEDISRTIGYSNRGGYASAPKTFVHVFLSGLLTTKFSIECVYIRISKVYTTETNLYVSTTDLCMGRTPRLSARARYAVHALCV